jgi:hypothetical protein
VGRVYALAGNIDEALPLLRAEAGRCGVVPSTGWPRQGIDPDVQHLQDRLLLGQLLEKKSDQEGACAQYAKILDRWGNAKPRSVTADMARERAKALACAR